MPPALTTPQHNNKRKKRQEWIDEEIIALCQVWPKQYSRLKKASTKLKNKIWLEIYAEFINKVDTRKDMEQMKTKTRAIEKEFKDIKMRMSRTGEEGAAKIKENIIDIYDFLNQYLSERDTVDPQKINIISSGLEFETNDMDSISTNDDSAALADGELETSEKSGSSGNKKQKKREKTTMISTSFLRCP